MSSLVSGGALNSSVTDLVTVPVPPGIVHQVESVLDLANTVNQETSMIVFYLTIAELLPVRRASSLLLVNIIIGIVSSFGKDLYGI